MKLSKHSKNHLKPHRGPKERRWKRRKLKLALKTQRAPARVGSNGRKVTNKSKRYTAPASYRWRP